MAGDTVRNLMEICLHGGIPQMPPGLQAFQGVSHPALHPFTVVPHGAGIVAESGI